MDEIFREWSSERQPRRFQSRVILIIINRDNALESTSRVYLRGRLQLELQLQGEKEREGEGAHAGARE